MDSCRDTDIDPIVCYVSKCWHNVHQVDGKLIWCKIVGLKSLLYFFFVDLQLCQLSLQLVLVYRFLHFCREIFKPFFQNGLFHYQSCNIHHIDSKFVTITKLSSTALIFVFIFNSLLALDQHCLWDLIQWRIAFYQNSLTAP